MTGGIAKSNGGGVRHNRSFLEPMTPDGPHACRDVTTQHPGKPQPAGVFVLVEFSMNTALLNCLAIGAAGSVGALARYGVARLFAPWISGQSFPWATLVINVTGSAFLGWFLTIITKRSPGPATDTLKLAIATGFVGAYTTFSTYMFESNDLLAKGSTLQAMGYLFGSLALGLIGVRLGIIVARL